MVKENKKVVDEDEIKRKRVLNAEAAKKYRLRKKDYIANLEDKFKGDAKNKSQISDEFVNLYTIWLDEGNQHVAQLKLAANQSHCIDDFGSIVEKTLMHFKSLYDIKRRASKTDVFNIMYGVWTSHVERCFIWMGGFRPSDLMKIVEQQVKPLTDQQSAKLKELILSTIQDERDLSIEFDNFHQSLADTLSTKSLFVPSGSSTDSNHMCKMSLAMGKLEAISTFLVKGDELRKTMLQMMHTILTTSQSARAVILIHDYFSQMRELSNLWISPTIV